MRLPAWVRSAGRSHSERRLVVTADDFGRSEAINAAVIRAHRRGVLTSASLMITADAAGDAVRLARTVPTLAVGLHLVLTEGRSCLPAGQVPHLVGGSGRLRSPLRNGVRISCSAAARRELRQELRAQFEAFASTGLPLSHVDGHQHLHLHPAVLPTAIRLAVEYGACGFRIPRDSLRTALRSVGRGLAAKSVRAAVLSLLSWRALRQLRAGPLITAGRTYGTIQSGDMHESYVIGLLQRIREPAAEIYFHPTTGPRLDALGPNPADLQTLLSPAVRQTIRECRFKLTTWPALAGS